ncbi:hypothetical protein [Paraburkholderia sp. D15]|uniref:hypothetical protein n=1 Tax=Paraburkholderia sp. D15 TaxID=2880218 RepID=UPI0032B06A85
MLRVRPGAVVTMTGWTFGVVDCGIGVVEPVPGVLGDVLVEGGGIVLVWLPVAGVSPLLPPPPPQPVRVAKAAREIARARRVGAEVMV